MILITYNPKLERPFSREGNREFLLKDNKSVPLVPGANYVDAELLKELEQDSFFKQLIEWEAIAITQETKPKEEPPTSNPPINEVPPVPPTPTIPTPTTPPATSLKSVKQLP